jgi:hypothetical protein
MRNMTAMQLGLFSKSHAEMSRRDFLIRYTDPFLVVEKEKTSSVQDFKTVDPDTADNAKRTDPGMPVLTQYGEGIVHVVQKSDRNSFAAMVTVGRSSNNDIVIEHCAISKLHALLRRDPMAKCFTVTDVGSTNGTTLDTRPISPNQSSHLTSGSAIIFGGAALATFFEPGDFFDYLELLRRTGKV